MNAIEQTGDYFVQKYVEYANDPWKFLTECVYTKDQADEGRIKPYPGDLEYLRLVCLLWQREQFLAIPKSRRMLQSWTMIPLALWDCIFHKGKSWAFASKKEDDAGELVERAQFVFNQIPEDKLPRALLPTIQGGKMTKSPPRLVFNFGSSQDRTQIESKIEGYPMTSDQLRQFGFSGILGDECAFWGAEADEFYTGARPTLESVDGKGGKMVLISSRAPGFFKKIVFDQLDNKTSRFPEIPPVPIKSPMQGVEIWKNPRNGFCVVDLHYTADPRKATPEFRESVKKGLPLHQFLREYERSWETFEGMPIYPNFRADLHCPSHALEAHASLPLLLSWDFGHTPACLVGQIHGKSLKILKEYTAQNETIKTFAPKVMNDVRHRFPAHHDNRKQHFHFIDPAGFKRNENDMRTCALEMEENAPIYNIAPGPVTWEARRQAVEGFLLYVDADGAGLEIDQAQCPVLVEGFKGAYRYPDSVNEIQPDQARPIKNIYSHPHDALQYLCYGAREKITEYNITIPAPSYSFQKPVDTPRRKHHGYKF